MNLRLNCMRAYLFLQILCVGMTWFVYQAMAGNLTLVSDIISESGIGLVSNHAVSFTIINTILPSGKIIITPQNEVFTIPATLDYTDVDFIVNGVNQSLTALPGVAAGSPVGVTVTSGVSGSITLTLNGADNIAPGSIVIIKIGTNAVSELAGSHQIQNPTAAGSYSIKLQTQNSAGIGIDSAKAMVAILPRVGIASSILAAPTSELAVIAGGGDSGSNLTVATILPAYVAEFISTVFNRTLAIGFRGIDVERLQQILSLDREIYTGKATGYFGLFTRAALIKFQIKHKIIANKNSLGAGILGPITRGKIQSLFGGQIMILRPNPLVTTAMKFVELKKRLDALRATVQALVSQRGRVAATEPQSQILRLQLNALRVALEVLNDKR